jgi:hypothetical protein
MRERALKWLYGQLKKRRVALGKADSKPRAPQEEIENLGQTIELIEWIIGKVLEGE